MKKDRKEVIVHLTISEMAMETYGQGGIVPILE